MSSSPTTDSSLLATVDDNNCLPQEKFNKLQEQLTKLKEKEEKHEKEINELSESLRNAKTRIKQMEMNFLDQATIIERVIERNPLYEDSEKEDVSKELLYCDSLETKDQLRNLHLNCEVLEKLLTRKNELIDEKNVEQEALYKKISLLEKDLNKLKAEKHENNFRKEQKKEEKIEELGTFNSQIFYLKTLDSLNESDIVKKDNCYTYQNYIREQYELDEVKRYKETALSDRFLVRKEHETDQHRWNLVKWNPSTSPPFDISKHKRTEFCIVSEASEVYLSGTFVNWECNLRCIPRNFNIHIALVDLPPGRYEFNFMINGKWHASDLHPKCTDFLGTENNFIKI